MKHPAKRLIIWRSQVQALAGPRSKSSTYKDFVGAFFMRLRKQCIVASGVMNFIK